MIVIVPCVGESSRFLGLKKQFLTHPLGLPLPIYSVTGLEGDNEFVFVFLRREFTDRFGDEANFCAQLKKAGVKGSPLLVEKQTSSPVATIALALAFLEMQNEPFYIKDCDNYFEAPVETNSVATVHINSGDFDIRNKSFSRGNPITEIKDRAVISPMVNVGGYGFHTGNLFLENMNKCDSVTEVIQKAINGWDAKFTQTTAKHYEDYGTLEDWNKYLLKFDKQ
jgi:hypothetical protein